MSSTQTITVDQWEYKLVRINPHVKNFGLTKWITEEDVLDQLSNLGALGWELCTERVENSGLVYIFKRPKQPTSTHSLTT